MKRKTATTPEPVAAGGVPSLAQIVRQGTELYKSRHGGTLPKVEETVAPVLVEELDFDGYLAKRRGNRTGTE